MLASRFSTMMTGGKNTSRGIRVEWSMSRSCSSRAEIRIPDQVLLDQVNTMATVTIEVPDEAFAALRRSPQELGREMRLAAAMLWYTQGRISHEKAAFLAGVSRLDFIDALAEANLPTFQVDVDELMEEVELA
jgi:predicted HTH domain antitoxin